MGNENTVYSPPPQIENLLTKVDPYLRPFEREIKRRYGRYLSILNDIEQHHGGLDNFTSAHNQYGVQVCPNTKLIRVREWLPAAKRVFIRGDFNAWRPFDHEFRKLDYGQWEIELAPNADGSMAIPENSHYKLYVETASGEFVDRLCPWSRLVKPPEGSIIYASVMPPQQSYKFVHERPKLGERDLRIYEAHVGISSKDPKVASYDHFRTEVLPRIVKQGYTAIQLMAIMEHAYYASFGYQITSFFAPSSRFGLPNELRQLVDECHASGIVVLLDLIHSHASKNTLDGLNELDGSRTCYFHESEQRGTHSIWDSRLFDYSNPETLRFLLSNVRYWMEEFRFDGFRFDGVTSMLYHSHGIAHAFSGSYEEYFGPATDTESFTYLTLANYLIHRIVPNAITIAEEVSGMPTLCRPIDEGGAGFDFRLAMALPDLWIKTLKAVKDEDWNLDHICFTLTNRRRSEANIAYAESHDQALVGDKTISFHLMDAEMYTNMSILSPLTPTIDRGISLHKLIRLLTYGLGGEGWLNFIGNEFGHPEWLDFPRKGNNNSFHYARRQWNLVDDDLLRYKFLNAFDRAMNQAEQRFCWLRYPEYISRKHYQDKVIVFERGSNGLLWVFNFHTHKSFADYKVGCSAEGAYRVVLDSDSTEFGGQGRIDHSTRFVAEANAWDNRQYSIRLYIPCRCAILLAIVDDQ